MSTSLRLTGLATGLDTDTLVKQMLRVQQIKIDRVQQQRQSTEWQRDAYRDMSNLLRGFKDTYFDVLKPATNFRSSSTFSSFVSKSSDESILTVSNGANVVPGSKEIVVSSLATTAKITSSGTVSDNTITTGDFDLNRMVEGTSFNVTLDGVTRTITLDQDYSGGTKEDFASGLNVLLENAFGQVNGQSKVSASIDAGTQKLILKPELDSSTIALSNSKYISTLGFSNNQTNSISSKEITDFTDFGTKSFKVQVGSEEAKTITVGDTTTINSISDLVSQINSQITDEPIKAIADGNKLKFIRTDSSAEKVTLTSADSDDLLKDIGISSGSTVKSLSGTINLTGNDSGKGFVIKINDGSTITEKNIFLSSDLTADSTSTIISEINSQLGAEVTASVQDGKLIFTPNGDYEISIGEEDILSNTFGLSEGNTSNRLDMKASLETLVSTGVITTPNVYDAEGNVNITINGVTIENVTKSDSIESIMTKINNSSAGVRMSYSSVANQFTIESKETGTGAKVDLDGEFFTALNLGTTDTDIALGSDASLTIDGTEISRSTNNFNIDGVSYNLKSEGTSTIDIEADSQGVKNKIVEFVEKYNEMIDKINGKLNEEKYRDFKPLTDEQKEAMKESEIEKWEEKAKSGLLRNDSVLQSITSRMRTALYETVDDVGISLYEIGITTSSNYLDRGKLVINEDKLQKALDEKPQQVAELFTKTSDDYSGKGISHKLYDIINENIRTTRDSNGRKGNLLEKAGIEGDTTEFNNMLNTKIKSYDNTISELLSDLADKENYYYNMFAKLESAMTKMNSQSQWLASQFGGGMM